MGNEREVARPAPHPAVADAPEEYVDIPQALFVNCPLAEHALRRVVDACLGCQHYHGLADRFPSEKRFEVRYAVLCTGAPMQRKMQRVEV